MTIKELVIYFKLEKSRDKPDESKRLDLYREAEKFMIENAPIINLIRYTCDRLSPLIYQGRAYECAWRSRYAHKKPSG